MIEQPPVLSADVSTLTEQCRHPAPVLFWLAGIADQGIKNIDVAEAVRQEPQRHYQDVIFALRHGLTLGYKPQHTSVQLSVEAVMRTVMNDGDKTHELSEAWEFAKRQQPSHTS